MSNVTHVDFSRLATKPPVNPSKWDIIPIHSSDRGAFKSCRRRWGWSSPSRQNLIPRASVYGVNKNLWFGTGIHYALERYYNPVIRENPWTAFEDWFNLQWRGGTVHENEVKPFADRNPQIIHNGNNDFSYKVDGLIDIIPDVNEELFLGMLDLGVGMMKWYKDYAEANDNFTVISVEHDFSVPVLNGKGEPLYSIDNRLMPDGWEPTFGAGNDFGPYMVEDTGTGNVLKQVHVRGRMDMIQREKEHGRYGILDYKTTSRLDDDYFRHLELDEQCTSYLAFGQLEAKLHGLEFQELEFITYQAMLKGYPKPPTVLQSGLPSLARTTETTTAALFEQFIRENGLKPIFDVDPKMQSYYTWLLELGDDRFIKRTDTWRNKIQRKNAMVRLYYEARDMLNDPVLYPNPTKEYACLNCVFRVPCIQAETGDDYLATLEDGFMPNWDR